MLACAALVVCSCQETDPKPELSFESGTYVMGADEAIAVKVVTNIAPSADLTVDFTISGTAAKDSDYELSAESFTIKAGETVGEITVTPKNNVASDLNISLTLTLPTGYEAGKHLNTLIALGAKETISYSFAQATAELIGETVVTLNLIGGTTGADFVATSEYRLPFTLEGTAVLGTNFEVDGNATEFVVAKGAKSASITLKAKNYEEENNTIIVRIDASAYGDMFEAGVNSTATVTMIKPLTFADLEGKWAYASTPILDDPEADCWTFGAMLMDGESGIDDGTFNDEFTGIVIYGFPEGTSNDILEFKTVDGQQTLIPSGNGSILNYFKECTVSGLTPAKYTWYYYDNIDSLGREYNVAEVTLSSANVTYSATSPSEREAKVFLCLSDDNNTLNVFITDYIPTEFFKTSYALWDAMGMWADMSSYYDLYFTFTRVAE